MQCGFGMLEAGSVTARATTNILLKNLLDASISAVMWYTVGFGLAFDGDNPLIGIAGTPTDDGRPQHLFFGVRMHDADAHGFDSKGSSSGYNWAFWWFQFVSAASSPPPPRVRARDAHHHHQPTNLLSACTALSVLLPPNR